MEPSKGNTVGIAKNSPSMRTTHFSEPFQDFFPQNGKDNKPNHPNQRHKANNVKNNPLFLNSNTNCSPWGFHSHRQTSQVKLTIAQCFWAHNAEHTNSHHIAPLQGERASHLLNPSICHERKRKTLRTNNVTSIFTAQTDLLQDTGK